MQLHSLRVEAFGPFAAPATVDFDELRQAGLFLFSGPTGSGKTSVLDAICFGLYGVVPGSRQAARQLRSDHASPEAIPRVELEFSVGDRRFRIARSPAWQRPKRRGSGVTPQNANVVLDELQGGEWVSLSTRLDEAGDQITALLGMRPSQFTQVTMLPQGEFQKFLVSRTDERQAILQKLFRTDRFEAVERHLHDRRIQLGKHVDAQLADLDRILNRVAEVSATPLPHDWRDDLPAAVTDDRIRAWCHQLVSGRAAELADLRDQLEGHHQRHVSAEESVREANSLVTLQHRGREARSCLDELEASGQFAQTEQDRLERHRRAQPALSLGRVHAKAAEELASVRQTAARMLQELALPSDLDLAAARQRLARNERKLHTLEEFLPRATAYERDCIALTGLRDELAEVDEAIASGDRAVAELPAQLEGLAQRIAEAVSAAASLDIHVHAIDDARDRLAAAVEAEAVCAELETQLARLSSAVTRHQDLREVWQDLREARIEGMAGELAAQLASGCSCPVCGSSTHPHPAEATPGPDAAAEDDARQAVDDAAIEAETLRDSTRSLDHQLTSLRVLSQGLTEHHWATALAEAKLAHEQTAAVADSRAKTQQEHTQTQRTLDSLTTEGGKLRERRAGLCERVEALASSIAAHEVEAARIMLGVEGDTTAEAVVRLRSVVTDLSRLVTVLAGADAAAAAESKAASDVLTEVSRCGFDDWPQVVGADLTPDAVAELEAWLTQRVESAAAAKATLAEDGVVSALAVATPDLETLEAELVTASQVRDGALAEVTARQAAQQRLESLLGIVEQHLSSLAPDVESLAVIRNLSELLEGRSPDNQLRMRLSAFVLGERLAQVVAAANDRLHRMGRDRFSLEQCDEGSSGQRRGGLGLRIRDSWTSTQRDTGTLSGGETFVVSLALALGLADTVTCESGGTRIETLFVDEGFGSLDTESLDAVLDTLESLREGGRSVGVVSHVTEMRERIPAQLRVSTGPHGGARLEVLTG